jgi:hypothetical protein
MPRLNGKGQAVMGVGGGPCSIDGVTVSAVGGAACWLDDNTIVFNMGNDHVGWNVVLMDVVSKFGGQLLGHGANFLAAGGGKWLAWTAGIGLEGAVKASGASVSLTNTDGRGEIGRDGTIAYVASQQAGMPTVLVAPDGAQTVINEAAYGLCVFGPGQAIWNGGGTTLTDKPKIFPNAKGIRVVMLDGQKWLVYWYSGKLVAHPWNDNTNGLLVHEGDDAFYHDAVTLPDGTLMIAWSRTQGEGPDHLVRVSYSIQERAAKMISLIATQPVPQIVGINAIPAFERKVWIAPFFSHSERYGDTPINEHVGNAILLVDNNEDMAVFARELDAYAKLGTPLIVQASRQVHPEHADMTVAYWAGNQAEVRNTMALTSTQALEKPVIWYEDTPTEAGWPNLRPDWMTERIWPAVQAYRAAGEAIDVFETRMRAMLNKVTTYGRPLALVPRFDDFNGSGSVQQTLEAMPVYAKLLNDYQIVAFLPFSDRRGNAICKNPALHSWAMTFKYAAPSRPNRFDYWQPATSDLLTILKNKFGQTTSLITLTKAEKDFILAALQRN